METYTPLEEKIFQYLLHLFDTPSNTDIHDFLVHCKILNAIDHSYSETFKLSVIADPEIYKKYQAYLKDFTSSIKAKLYQFTQVSISEIQIFPDLNKFQILENRIVPINTPWQEINTIQNKILEQLRTAKQTVDYQNIGNSCRTVLQKMANLIFKTDIHLPEDNSIDLSEGKFKNRLHTYIKVELGGKENKEMRDYAISIITTAEKSIDLSNKLTHDLKANSFMAESCVISTLSVISIIKLLQ